MNELVCASQVYFMSPSRETSWTLPLTVFLELDPEQQDFIRDRIFEFEQRTRRRARARMMLSAAAAGDTSAAAVVGNAVSTLPMESPEISGYICPTPPSSEIPPTVLSPARPVSVFPPDHPPSSERSSTKVNYMCMNGIRQ